MMLEHVDRLSEETMKRLDLREANVDQIVRVMKEVREGCMSDVGIRTGRSGVLRDADVETVLVDKS